MGWNQMSILRQAILIAETYSSISSFPREFDGRSGLDRAGQGGESDTAFSDRGKNGGAKSESGFELHL